jgi:hypothetical protein
MRATLGRVGKVHRRTTLAVAVFADGSFLGPVASSTTPGNDLSMTTYPDGGPRTETTGCPLCENYESHSRSEGGMLTCALCNTSWGTGRTPPLSRQDLEAKVRRNLGPGNHPL